MTGRRQRARDIREQYPELESLLSGNLHPDWSEDFPTAKTAISAAVAQYDLAALKELALEWWDWNAKLGHRADNVWQVRVAFAAHIQASSELEIRSFMNWVYDEIITRIRAQDQYWRPNKGQTK